MEVTESDKHTSLPPYVINYGCRNLYITAPWTWYHDHTFGKLDHFWAIKNLQLLNSPAFLNLIVYGSKIIYEIGSMSL